MHEFEIWTPPEAALWLPDGADYEFHDMTAIIRLRNEIEEEAYNLTVGRDPEARVIDRPSTSAYRYENIKPLLGYDLWGFLFDLEQLYRQNGYPTLTKSELMRLTGWGWTKTKDNIRRLRSRQVDSEREFQLLKLHVPGMRPAPHWHAKGSAAWQFVLLDGEILVSDRLKSEFRKNTAALLAGQRSLKLSQPQGVGIRPSWPESIPQGVENHPGWSDSDRGGQKTTPCGMENDPLRDGFRPPATPPIPPMGTYMAGHGHAPDVPGTEDGQDSAAPADPERAGRAAEALTRFGVKSRGAIRKLTATVAAVYWTEQWLTWAPFVTHWRDRAAGLVYCIRQAVEGNPECRIPPDGYDAEQKRRARHLTATPRPTATPDAPGRPTPPAECADLDTRLRAAVSQQKAITSGRVATVSIWSLQDGTLTFAGFAPGDIALAEAKRDVLLQLAKTLDVGIQDVAFTVVPGGAS